MSCTQFGYNSNTTPTQLLMSSQPAPASAPPSASATQLSSPSSGCCESGRPIITDPLTGQTVCSCQYDPQTQLLNYQRLASAGIPLYSNPYAEQGYLPLSAEQSAFYTPSTNGFELKDNLGTWPYAASVYYPYDTTLAGYPFTNGYGVDLNGARRKNATRETTSTLKAWLSEHKKNPYPTKGEKIMLAIITKMTLTQVSTWFANARRRLKKENKMTWEPRNRVDDEDNTGDNGDADKDSDKGTRDPSDRTTPAPSPVGLLGRDVGGPPTLTLSSAIDCDKLSSSTARGAATVGNDVVGVGVGDLHRLRPGHQQVVDRDDEDDSDDDKSISVSIGGHDCLDSGLKGGGGGERGGGPDGLLMSDSLSSPASSVLSEPASSIHSPLSVDSQPTPSAVNNNSGHHHHTTSGSDGVATPHKPRIWSIVDTATSNSTPAAQAAAAAAAAAALAHHGSPTSSHAQPPPLYPSGIASGGGLGHHAGSNITKVKPLSARSFRLDYGSPYGKPASWFNGSYAAAAAAAAAAGAAPSGTESLLNPFSKAGGLMVAGAAASYSSLASALTTTTTLSGAGGGRASCVSSGVPAGLNKGLPPSMAALQRNAQPSPRFHGAFTLNSKLDCQVHQDQRQELQGPAS